MKKYKFYILAVISALILSLIQLLIGGRLKNENEGHIYVLTKDIQRGELLRDSDFEKISIKGYNSDFLLKDDYISAINLSKGSILSNSFFQNEYLDDKDRIISLHLDNSRLPLNDIKVFDKVSLFIIPDSKKMGDLDWIKLERLLKEEKIPYNPERDLGFVLDNLVIRSLPLGDYLGKGISLKVPASQDIIISFLKDKASMEIIFKGN